MISVNAESPIMRYLHLLRCPRIGDGKGRSADEVWRELALSQGESRIQRAKRKQRPALIIF